MSGNSNWTPLASSSSSFENQEVLDVKPLRTLAPMRPDQLGLNASPNANAASFVCDTPFGSFRANSDSNFYPFFQTSKKAACQTTPIYAATPLNSRIAPLPINVYGSTSGKRMKQKICSSEIKRKLVPKKARTVYHHDTGSLVPSSLHGTRESVEAILMTYEALRRRMEQVDEANNDGKRAYLKVWPIMVKNNLRANVERRIGVVPGVEIGDMYYFRFEMCLIGLHFQTMAGIDTVTARFDNFEDTVAACVVSSGGYDNEDNDVDTMIYSGQGGSRKDDKNYCDDQKLERGNLALERSLHCGNEVRVVRSAKDFMSQTGKIYIYDGIYKIQKSWMEKGKGGSNVFKFKLVREPGQPSGIGVWKMTQKWLENPSSRGSNVLFDISFGVENIPICLVNEVDNEERPHFTYVTKVKYVSRVVLIDPVCACTCQSVCLPGDLNCSCAQQNDGYLPYSANGLLVSRKPIIFECSSACSCHVNCRNRVTQKGVKLNFEVFRTNDRGWGIRCWHPIRAGTFICECTGEVVDKTTYQDDDGNEYIFKGLVGDNLLKWNYNPELLGEESSPVSSEAPGNLNYVINGKSMGNMSRFMNHSCSPNVFWQPVMYDHSDDKFPHIMFFAIKNIPPMTELTYDYGLSDGEGVEPWKAKKCLCGSSKCRGLFG